ncbi:hypothetical protein AAV99_04090 [Aurantiacibacter marinus]|uniref:Uncharacterized protein n=2 Tax=Aurantiacibacter marinus TaxID=874156 RepID=A0A0H0XRT6_9SPHN|nr:hypothetical protein AAV99_04090 [Aurantiacibacter marinus]
MSKSASGGTDRRGALRLALAAAMAPALATRQSLAQTVPGTNPGGLIDPPSQPMIYQRTVSRELVDGNSFSVSRFFAVEFHRSANGFMLHGRQNDVAVNAPQELASFASLESARDESHIFPLALDAFGRILSREHQRPSEPVVQAAVNQTLTALRDSGMAEEDRSTLQAFAAAVHSAGHRITAHLPIDLFAPASQVRDDEQSIALPHGGHGRVTTRFRGEINRNTGLMSAASREITTEVGDDRRITSESWNLALS